MSNFYPQPMMTVQATPHELIALGAAITHHLTQSERISSKTKDQLEMIALLRSFQGRLVSQSPQTSREVTETLFKTFPFSFTRKPLLFAGKAMEYYGLREAGDDIDLIVHPTDFRSLSDQYPGVFENTFGDEGLRIDAYEFYQSQFGIEYDTLLGDNLEEQSDYRVITLESLLVLRAFACMYDRNNQKAKRDITLLVGALHLKDAG